MRDTKISFDLVCVVVAICLIFVGVIIAGLVMQSEPSELFQRVIDLIAGLTGLSAAALAFVSLTEWRRANRVATIESLLDRMKNALANSEVLVKEIYAKALELSEHAGPDSPAFMEYQFRSQRMLSDLTTAFDELQRLDSSAVDRFGTMVPELFSLFVDTCDRLNAMSDTNEKSEMVPLAMTRAKEVGDLCYKLLTECSEHFVSLHRR